MIITRKDLERYPILHEWARVRMLWLAEFKPMLIKERHLEDPNLLFDHLNSIVEQAMRTYLNLEEKGVSDNEAMESSGHTGTNGSN